MDLLKENKKVPLTLIVPLVFILFLIVIFPTGYSFYVSLFDWNPSSGTGMHFIGLGNYLGVITNAQAVHAIGVTLLMTAIAVSVEFFLGLGMALILTQSRSGVKFVRSILIMPMVLAPIIVGLMWRYIYFPDGGIFGYISVNLLHLPLQEGVLASTKTALLAVVIADIWEWTPFVSLILIGGLQSISIEAVESARVDGATATQIFRFITMPLMRSFILVALLFRTMDLIKVFDIVYALTRGGPGEATTTISFFTYQEGLSFFNLGFASALSWVVLIIVTIISQFYIRVLNQQRI